MKVAPFDVRLRCQDKWDPSAAKLQTGYDINDPNGRIRRARIRFHVVGPSGEVVAHEVKLTAAQFQHGSHERPEAKWWDGLLDTALPDRKGETVTAELSPVHAELEAWNTDHNQPGKRQRGDRNRTDREGEYVARSKQLVDIDSILKAKWDRNWCIPRMGDGHPDHDKGVVSMTIEARNVREGEVARPRPGNCTVSSAPGPNTGGRT